MRQWRPASITCARCSLCPMERRVWWCGCSDAALPCCWWLPWVPEMHFVTAEVALFFVVGSVCWNKAFSVIDLLHCRFLQKALEAGQDSSEQGPHAVVVFTSCSLKPSCESKWMSEALSSEHCQVQEGQGAERHCMRSALMKELMLCHNQYCSLWFAEPFMWIKWMNETLSSAGGPGAWRDGAWSDVMVEKGSCAQALLKGSHCSLCVLLVHSLLVVLVVLVLLGFLWSLLSLQWFVWGLQGCLVLSNAGDEKSCNKTAVDCERFAFQVVCWSCSFTLSLEKLA